MRSPKGFWLAAGAVFFITAGMFLASGSVLVMSLPLVVYLAVLTLFSEHAADARLEVTRKLEQGRIMAGDEMGVEVCLRNTGSEPVLVEAVDMLPAYVELAGGSNACLLSLEPGEETAFGYALRCPLRGRYALDSLRLRVMDPERMLVADSVMNEASQFSVIARVEPLRRVRIEPRKTRNWVGNIRSRCVGQGTEFYGLRDYVPGDEMRRVNWKVSSRLDRLVTNEMEAERSGDLTIILDARQEANVGPAEDSAVEHGVRAASSIARNVLSNKNRVGLVVLRDIIDEVYPAFGSRQFYRLSEHLLDVKPLGLLPFENVGWMVTSYFPLESQIIVISTLHDPEIIRTIGDLCARGYDVVVLSPDGVGLERKLLDDSAASGLASRILALERANLITELNRYARVLDWDTDEPLAKILRGVSAYRGR